MTRWKSLQNEAEKLQKFLQEIVIEFWISGHVVTVAALQDLVNILICQPPVHELGHLSHCARQVFGKIIKDDDLKNWANTITDDILENVAGTVRNLARFIA